MSIDATLTGNIRRIIAASSELSAFHTAAVPATDTREGRANAWGAVFINGANATSVRSRLLTLIRNTVQTEAAKYEATAKYLPTEIEEAVRAFEAEFVPTIEKPTSAEADAAELQAEILVGYTDDD